MPNDSDLDDLLATSAPGVPGRPDDVDQALLDLARDSELSGQAPRWRRRSLVAGIAVVAVVGAGGAAAASGLVPGWTPWPGTFGDSTGCRMMWAVDPADGPVPEAADIPRPAYDDAAVAEANAFLARYDYGSVDREAAVTQAVADADADRAEAGLPPLSDVPASDTSAVDEHSDEFESHAVMRRVEDDLDAHLRASGFDPSEIALSGVVTCDQ